LESENILYFQYNSCWSRELAEKHNLPNTGLRVSYSTNYFKLLKDTDPDSLYPEITVETKFEDFLNGRDTILEMIKNID
jgi:hypothetical protein